MDFVEFRKIYNIYKDEIYNEILSINRNSIRVKKEQTVIKNLEKIFEAALKISNRKGFQAMSMRSLSKESGLSMGALYAYFSSKEELLEMLQRQHSNIMFRIFEYQIKPDLDAQARLNTAIRTHLYLSEAMRPWFYFAYMETKNMPRIKQERAMESELLSEKIFSDIIKEGIKQKIFINNRYELTAGAIKALLQDWYLKRWKYSRRKISVDEYAAFIINLIKSYVFKPN